MLSVFTCLALVALPAINAQALTTITLNINGKETSIVLPLPQAPTTTVYMTMPAATITQTTAFPQSIATQTIVVAAPVDQISSIAGEIPTSYQVPAASLQTPAAIVPVTINGYTTALNLPSSASVPTGTVTLSPVIVAPPPPSQYIPSFPANSIQTAIGSLSSS
ncbi:MAG: hypothetical protein Q9218_007248, partial [Villophora microphyllina]